MKRPASVGWHMLPVPRVRCPGRGTKNTIVTSRQKVLYLFLLPSLLRFASLLSFSRARTRSLSLYGKKYVHDYDFPSNSAQPNHPSGVRGQQKQQQQQLQPSIKESELQPRQRVRPVPSFADRGERQQPAKQIPPGTGVPCFIWFLFFSAIWFCVFFFFFFFTSVRHYVHNKITAAAVGKQQKKKPYKKKETIASKRLGTCDGL